MGVLPLPSKARGVKQSAELERLKGRLLAERLETSPNAPWGAQVRRAAAEAAAVSWMTRYPLLLFPGLFEELAAAAMARARRQEQIRQRSRLLLAA